MQDSNIKNEISRLNQEILTLREDLKTANDRVKNVGKSVPFYRILILPAIFSLIGALILWLLGYWQTPDKVVGILSIIFWLAMIFSMFKVQKEIKAKKEKFIEERIEIQKKILAKSKKITRLIEDREDIEN